MKFRGWLLCFVGRFFGFFGEIGERGRGCAKNAIFRGHFEREDFWTREEGGREIWECVFEGLKFIRGCIVV